MQLIVIQNCNHSPELKIIYFSPGTLIGMNGLKVIPCHQCLNVCEKWKLDKHTIHTFSCQPNILQTVIPPRAAEGVLETR